LSIYAVERLNNEKITDDERTEGERTPSDTKSSHGLLLGELKKTKKKPG